MNFADLVPEGRPNEIRKTIDNVVKDNTIKSFKTRQLTKNGKILDIWLTATALTDESGQPVEIAITERDLAWLPKDYRGRK